jgi:hypothetical protein
MGSFDQNCRIESNLNQELNRGRNRARRFPRLVWMRKESVFTLAGERCSVGDVGYIACYE